ncbi:MAG: NUDIX hydrolase [Clostridia bacterium]|nr:NUDIX hydrolase [Clostridia bacterium]
MAQENTNWSQSAAAVCIREGKVLLARHTYGSGTGKLIIPGGYVNMGEAPQDAVKREFLEETGVVIEPGELIGVRFNDHDWYVVFLAEYVSGEARSDGEENSEVVWMDPVEAMKREDVPELTKIMIGKAFQPGAWVQTPFRSSRAGSTLYCAE